MNNIFKFATSELSQDALLCYWFNFATNEHFDESIPERESAQELLATIISKWTKTPIDYSTIKVNKIVRQFNHIDVLLQVNNKYLILIEDKIYTSERTDQVSRYVEELEKYDKDKILSTFNTTMDDKIIIPVYFKMIDQSEYKETYIPITRSIVLNILNKYSFEAASLIEMFKEHVSDIENQVENYNDEPFSNWGFNHFSGFYSKLKDSLDTSRGFGYGAVPNKKGTFFGCWWYFSNKKIRENMGFKSSVIKFSSIKDIYLQIEKNSKGEFQLALKMCYIPSKLRRDIQEFNNDINMIDQCFSQSVKFNKKNRTNLFSEEMKYIENKERWVTLFKCPLDLNNLEETSKSCQEAQLLLDSLVK